MKSSRSYFPALIASLLVIASVNQLSAAQVRDIRWDTKTNPAYTRVVVELSEATPIKKHDKIRDSRYMYVDFYRITEKCDNRSIPIDNGVLKALLVVDYRQQQVLRLIFYFDTPSATYAIQELQNPYRIVIDIFHPPVVEKPSLSQRLALALANNSNRKVVVIDPGHGGSDPGAQSKARVNGRIIDEADLNLALALTLKQLIDKSPNMVARLTRTSDRHVSLDNRIRLANYYKGDIFISLHYNSTRDSKIPRDARGLELYYLDPASASRTTMPSGGRQEMSRELIAHSRLVCRYLEQQFMRHSYFRRYSRGIKTDRFHVLLQQPQRPTALIEVGFLSNSAELKEILKAANREVAATCIYNALELYFASVDRSFKLHQLKIPR